MVSIGQGKKEEDKQTKSFDPEMAQLGAISVPEFCQMVWAGGGKKA